MKGRVLVVVLVAAFFLAAAASYAQVQEDIAAQKNCRVCGMSREMFSQSRFLVEYDNGSVSATCSARCAALDMSLNMGRMPKSIRVADFTTRQLIDAEKAYWVIGGKKEGVMSSRAKWAFQKKQEAEGFRAKNGGKPGTFQEALKASFEDMYKDLKTFWGNMKKHDH